MDLSELIPNHPSEESLEAYILRQLDSTQEAHLEEHLLLCDHCRSTLEELEEFVTVMKSVTATYAEGEAAPSPPLLRRLNPFANRAGLGRPGAATRRTSFGQKWLPYALGSAAAAICLVVVTSLNFWPDAPILPARTVELSAFRGGGDAISARTPAGAPLELSMDAADLGQSGAFTYRIEIVDETGERMWSAPAELLESRRLSARVDKILNAGKYFVRLYRIDSPNDPGELLREASLLLE